MTVHDVVIIGSGAGGGTVTKVLADLGVRVLLMEAGPMVTMSDFKTLDSPLDAWHRGAGDAATLYSTGQGAPLQNTSIVRPPNLTDEPYTVAPGSQFRWSRSRVIGGRTNHYGRIQLRYSDYDFKNKSMLGVGFDWPIAYEDLAPYYDKAERFIGVTGRPEGLRSAPDGIFQTPAPWRPHEHLIYRACEKLGIKATSSRQAVITSPLNGRPGCIYCGNCGRGCTFRSNYASSYVQIFPAMETGRVTVLANAMARELVTDASGKVTAVSYIDKATGEERQVRCRTVVLSASSGESARLLLNSKSARHPHGVGNSGGMVGKYLTDTVGFSLSGSVPYMRGMPPFATAGYGAHLYIPWWKADRHNELDFPLGYHVELGGGGFATPALGFGAQAYEQSQGYGLPMKKAIRDVVRKRDQCQFHRPRSDGAERGLLLRDRSGWREGQVGHSGPALPLEMERLRAERGAPHARQLHGDHRDDGRDRQRGRGTRRGAPHRPRLNRRTIGRSSVPEAGSSTRWAASGWAPTRTTASSTGSARSTRSPTCSPRTAGHSRVTATRTPRTRSSRSRGGRPSILPKK